jgi:hypothetical protein
MIALKRKHLGVFSAILNIIKKQLNKSKPPLNLDIKDENRNTAIHHLISLIQDDLTKDIAIKLI